ncbi:MAG: response regulator [Candidatus Omnitrophota bacterium]
MKKRILIIEDNGHNMMLQKDLLETAGFEVLEAKCGAEGIALAKKGKPDAIVMDVRLPDMRGTQAAHRLRQRPETCDIPIIFVTASVIGDGVTEIMSVQNAMFLTKPINTRTFAQEINQYLLRRIHG